MRVVDYGCELRSLNIFHLQPKVGRPPKRAGESTAVSLLLHHTLSSVRQDEIACEMKRRTTSKIELQESAKAPKRQYNKKKNKEDKTDDNNEVR